MKYLDRSMLKTMDDSRQFINTITNGINNNDAITWAINQKNDPKLIGTIGFWRIIEEHFRAEIGYLLHPDFQGQGFMQEALEVVLDYGFRTLKLHSIEANVNPNNLSSITLLERNGFVKEAYFKENYYFDGKFLDTVIYSVINMEDHR
jgi:ribosomal-protein-alanine N-acetyltransferase